jgi:hypothetical protein
MGRREFGRPTVETGVSPLTLHKRRVKSTTWEHVNQMRRQVEAEEMERMEEMIFPAQTRSAPVIIQPQSFSTVP